MILYERADCGPLIGTKLHTFDMLPLCLLWEPSTEFSSMAGHTQAAIPRGMMDCCSFNVVMGEALPPVIATAPLTSTI